MSLHQTDVAANVSYLQMRRGSSYYSPAVTEYMTEVEEGLITIYSLKVQLNTLAGKTR